MRGGAEVFSGEGGGDEVNHFFVGKGSYDIKFCVLSMQLYHYSRSLSATWLPTLDKNGPTIMPQTRAT